MNKFTTIGLDTAKAIFHLIACNAHGKMVLKKTLRRNQLLNHFANLEPCLVGLEACSSSHHWGRELTKLGHDVKLIPAQHVKPYLRGNKNDYNDALAIAEAVVRPEMRFVAIKTIQQQDQGLISHKRQEVIDARTQLCNRIRAMLSERGVIINKGIASLKRSLPALIENIDQGLSDEFVCILSQDYSYLQQLDKHLAVYDQQIKITNAQSNHCKRLLEIPGFGPVVTAAFSSHIGDGEQFSKGRDVAASLGVVPAQHSSGGKQKLLGISKRGNCRLRSLVIHGARSVVSNISDKQDPLSKWIRQLVLRVGIHKATVAYANKMIRMAWAVTRYGIPYDPTHAAKFNAQGA
ncbi:MAG: transposase [Saprospiraceae bacterium]|jgi:transposase